MALITTHIRFALELAKYHRVNNLEKYISGTVYPDSRWVTGIDREFTHHSRFLKEDFPENDFTLGWHIHCVCDEIQNREFGLIYPEAGSMDQKERWIMFSAAKVVQDMIDLQQFDVQSMLPYLEYIETPNNENFEQVYRFYRIIQHTYRDKGMPTPSDYGELWLSVGLDRQTTEKLVFKLEEILEDTEKVQILEVVFERMVQAYETQFVQSST